MGSERGGLSSSPPPSRLFVKERRPECQAKRPRRHRHNRRYRGLPDPGCARFINRTRRGPPAPGPAPPTEVQSVEKPATARGRPALLDSHSPAHPARARSLEPGGAVGEGAADTYPKLPASPHPERKAKERERDDKRKDSTLRVRGWELPLPPREVRPLAAPLPRTHPPSHLSFFHLPATFHFSGLRRLAWKVGRERCGG